MPAREVTETAAELARGGAEGDVRQLRAASAARGRQPDRRAAARRRRRRTASAPDSGTAGAAFSCLARKLARGRLVADVMVRQRDYIGRSLAACVAAGRRQVGASRAAALESRERGASVGALQLPACQGATSSERNGSSTSSLRGAARSSGIQAALYCVPGGAAEMTWFDAIIGAPLLRSVEPRRGARPPRDRTAGSAGMLRALTLEIGLSMRLCAS